MKLTDEQHKIVDGFLNMMMDRLRDEGVDLVGVCGGIMVLGEEVNPGEFQAGSNCFGMFEGHRSDQEKAQIYAAVADGLITRAKDLSSRGN
jgi:cobyrinic acid a,c-diamide synthase